VQVIFKNFSNHAKRGLGISSLPILSLSTSGEESKATEECGANVGSLLEKPSIEGLNSTDKSLLSFNRESKTSIMGEGGGATANNVYIRCEEYAWIPARLVEQDSTSAKVAIPQYENEESIASDGGKGAVGFKSAIVKLKDYQNHSLPLQNVGNDGSLKEVDDMVDLPYLHEVSSRN
jgi:hypothetical protein